MWPARSLKCLRKDCFGPTLCNGGLWPPVCFYMTRAVATLAVTHAEQFLHLRSDLFSLDTDSLTRNIKLGTIWSTRRLRHIEVSARRKNMRLS